MQQFIYGIVRTYPFWAIPVGCILLRATWGVKARDLKGTKKFAFFVMGVFLIVSSVAFLYYHGHELAVPMAHDLLYDPHHR